MRLDDTRYEIRDAQHFMGLLADEQLIDPTRIGAIGPSYGGGISLALAALKNRVMLPDGSLVPWTSPGGRPMEIAGAAPWITWSDLAYALVPNGSTLDYAAENPYRGRFGVQKESLVSGLYVSGLAAPGYYAPEGTPGADLTGWRNFLNAGEPYQNPTAQNILDLFTRFKSAYYIDPSVEPAPILYANGFTDDLFPVDEAVRYFNMVRERPPGREVVAVRRRDRRPSAQRERGRGPDRALQPPGRLARLLREGRGPRARGRRARDRADLPGRRAGRRHAHRRQLGRARARRGPHQGPEQAHDRAGFGRPGDRAGIRPGLGPAAPAPRSSRRPRTGTVEYVFPPSPGKGYTLLGSPTLIADFKLPGDTSQVAARLLDVAPDGTERLVARGLWRPATGGPKKQVFQLHPNGWHFETSHVPVFQLLAKDAGGNALNSYGRPSDNQQPVTVENADVRLPVAERPGALKGYVDRAGAEVRPEGLRARRGLRRPPAAGAEAQKVDAEAPERRSLRRRLGDLPEGVRRLQRRRGPR